MARVDCTINRREILLYNSRYVANELHGQMSAALYRERRDVEIDYTSSITSLFTETARNAMIFNEPFQLAKFFYNVNVSQFNENISDHI